MASKRLKKKKQAVELLRRQQTAIETEEQVCAKENECVEHVQTETTAQEVCFQIEVNLQEEEKEMKQMNFYVQWNGKEYCQADITEKIKEQWKAEGNTEESLETLSIYLKPEEERAYYVANGSVQGCIKL